MKRHGVTGGAKICLNCPYPKCIFDFGKDKAQRAFAERMLRNDAIVEMSAHKFSNRQIAEKFGINERHVRRIREQHRKMLQLREKEMQNGG